MTNSIGRRCYFANERRMWKRLKQIEALMVFVSGYRTICGFCFLRWRFKFYVYLHFHITFVCFFFFNLE